MLQLKNIKKTYHVGNIDTIALDDISISFREKEFVAILGTSGSGKTTCLNIIGGLDRYDSGELIINNRKTSTFKEKDWDAYRNNSIGFVFQSYNLINHLSIVDNVEMAMTLSGVKRKIRKKKAIEALKNVGLADHIHKKPNQLSGGQMQRVAIARALVNNPSILLCDEPTGALDSQTSKQIMELIKSISKDRLVIMVTHNPEIANEYADRIVRFKDGKITADSNEYNDVDETKKANFNKTSMNFFTALKLSFNNIRTKKGRTFLTAFASSIGIIGISLILSLSSGFQKHIDNFQKEALTEYPIIVSKNAMQIDEESINELKNETDSKNEKDYPDDKKVFLFDIAETNVVHNNNLSNEFLDYIGKVDKNICSGIGYSRMVGFNLLVKNDGKVSKAFIQSSNNQNQNSSMMSMSQAGLSSYPKMLDSGQSYIEQNYDLLSGKYPKDATDLVLVVDKQNRVDYNVLKNIGFETDDIKSLDFDKIVGYELMLVSNDDFYKKTEFGTYTFADNLEEIYDLKNNIKLNICGIVRQKQDNKVSLLSSSICYCDSLCDIVIENEKDSQIVLDQKKSNKNLLTMQDMTADEKEMFLSTIGGSSVPIMLMLYPTSFENKTAVINYIDNYNKNKSDKDVIVYTDLAEVISKMTSSIIDGITLVLIAFAAVSLFVSLIMICIITYISVLERTKEIGILKALGARKKDIARVFNAETCILGIFSGALGILIAALLTIPINHYIYISTELQNVATPQISHSIFLIVISTILTVIGGYIPALIASKKNAVDALRTE